MIRKIITIDAEKCNGCGACVTACHEGAIVMRNGKAVLLRDDYCDGLGDCLPACPTDAISFVEREALPYDEEAVKANMAAGSLAPPPGGCPGIRIRELRPQAKAPACESRPQSRLRQWPVQIKLVPAAAPFFAGADLLVAADCSAFAHANFHQEFMDGKVTIIGCPKLDGVDYAARLRDIIAHNDIKSLTVVRMSVPCCGGLEHAVTRALGESGKTVPLRVAVIGTDGRVLA